MRRTVIGGAPALRPAAVRTADHAVRLGVDPAQRDAVELAVHELLANALEHGHAGDPALPIDVEVDGQDGGPVTVRVTDRAVRGPFEGRTRLDRGDVVPARPGHGWRLIHAGVSGVRVHSGPGATVVVAELATVPAVAGPDR